MNYIKMLNGRFEIEDTVMNIIDRFIGFPILIIVYYLSCIFGNKLIGLKLNINVIIIILLISIISAFFTWIKIRNISKFKDDEIGIIISFTTQETEEKIEVNKELRMILNSLKRLVRSEDIKTTIKIKKIPDRLCPEDDKSAHKIRDKYKASLIIWGDANYGNIANKKQTTFIPIKFSYSLKIGQDNTFKFNQNLTNLLQKNQKWAIENENNIIDRNYLVKNLEKFSIYIIGFVYYGKNNEKSEYFLKKSLRLFEINIDKNDFDLLVTLFNIRRALFNLNQIKIKNLELWPSNNNLEKEIIVAENIIKDINKLEFNVMSNNLMAIIYTAKSNYDLAIENLDKIPKEIIEKDSAILFNYSYVFYAKDNVIEGTRYLIKSIRANFLKLSPQSTNIARWLEDELSKNPLKIYLNFPLGIIYCDLMGDKILSNICLKKSIEYAKEKESLNRIYYQIRYESEKRLKKINRI